MTTYHVRGATGKKRKIVSATCQDWGDRWPIYASSQKKKCDVCGGELKRDDGK